jgi:nitrogen regulatory protein PII-like uncharacterized protein
MRLLTLGRDPGITAAFLAQLDAMRPRQFQAFTSHSPEEFRSLAEEHRTEIDVVLLGAAQTDEQAAVAQTTVDEVWGEGKMKVLRLPASLLTDQGKESGMLKWFLEHLE